MTLSGRQFCGLMPKPIRRSNRYLCCAAKTRRDADGASGIRTHDFLRDRQAGTTRLPYDPIKTHAPPPPGRTPWGRVDASSRKRSFPTPLGQTAFYLAELMGFEPTISGSTIRRGKPDSSTAP